MSDNTYIYQTKCFNCKGYINYYIIKGLTLKNFFKSTKNRTKECDNCGVFVRVVTDKFDNPIPSKTKVYEKDNKIQEILVD